MFSSELASVINQFEELLEKDPWYGSSLKALFDQVNPEWIFKAPVKGIHSIAELLTHMITWQNFAVKQIIGESDFKPNQEDSFIWDKQFPKGPGTWELMKNEFISGTRNMISLLRQYDDSLMDQLVPNFNYTYRFLLNGVIQHNLYHTGQISLIRKIYETKYQFDGGILRYGYRIFPFESLVRQK